MRMFIITSTIITTITTTIITLRTNMVPIAGAATITTTIITMVTAITMAMPASAKAGTGAGNALPLLVWLSPAFPVGSFAYSHGIEWAYEAGDVTDAATAQSWIAGLVARGGPWSDAVLLGSAHRAARAEEFGRLHGIAEFAAALAPSRERKLETMAQGEAFMNAVSAAWMSDAFEKILAAIGRETAYPVAVGVAAAAHVIPLRVTLESYLLAVVSNFVSAAVRLIPLGQTDGTKIVAALTPLVREVALRAEQSSLDDVGGAAIRSDIASMKHETQYTRLFRS